MTPNDYMIIFLIFYVSLLIGIVLVARHLSRKIKAQIARRVRELEKEDLK